MQTSCDAIDLLLASSFDASLSPSDRSRIDGHLARCTSCALVAATSRSQTVFPIVAADAYELGPVIGIGGMGRIRIARDRRIGREVAIKELLWPTDDLVARFVREVRLAAALQHPNIIPIFEVGCWPDGAPFYTMPLVRGQSLFDAFASRSLAERLRLLPSLESAIEAIAFAHGKGVLHRDLTPANIMIGDAGGTIVIDWGLAKELHVPHPRITVYQRTGTTPSLTPSGSVVGSPAYMAPEQAAGAADERSDIYALGAILYHLLAGRAPYEGSARQIITQLRERGPDRLSKLSPRAPALLIEIADRAMSRVPSERYSTASELLAALEAFKRESLAKQLRFPSIGGLAVTAAAAGAAIFAFTW